MRNANCKILDCTVRDGGLVNNWDFSVDFVRDLYYSLSEAGVEYMEIGYKNSPKLLKGGDAGPWRFLDEAFLREVIPQKTDTKLSALVDIGRVDENDILPRGESLLDLIRVACYLKDVDKGIELAEKFHALGYETTINIMALSHALENELNEALQAIGGSNVDVVYVVDSYGSMDPKDVAYMTEKFKRALPNKTLGIHTHNNMQLAYANTLAGIEGGITFLDSSVYGMGRAAGNCTTELLLGSLKNPRYELRPVLGFLEKHMVAMREKWEWGYNIPYMLTGMLNEHPRSAMALRTGSDKDKYVEYYDRLTTPETAFGGAKSE
ncbi:aldolase catalytic domain-containing protein [Paenibacillus sp.]|uniref:aldolase catalytic domain-containing protein n=1 Tax=Paenibacillus sp. TaxID=58172 RepID=UPI002D28359C|nr:aldolase catalytic domain-containing protein [Paenibacillus sp.]HZG58419.1 aldolase catalytic domain-containing protein [Paenibacillus sp.]